MGNNTKLHLSQANNFLLALIVLVIAILFFQFLGAGKYLFIVLLAGLIFSLAFLRTDFALTILIFSMLFSPELSLGGVYGRSVIVRLEDILLFVIFFGWLAKIAINKELGFLRASPLNGPIFFYAGIYLVTTLAGIILGTTKFKEGFFYFLKYFEYFLLFFMAANNIKDIKQARFFVYAFILTAFLISGYAWFQHFTGAQRVSAPFEGKEGEPNTLGGYLLLIIAVAGSLFLHSANKKIKIFTGIFLIAAFIAVLFTLSRGSWVSFVPAYAAFIFLARRGKLVLLVLAGVFLVTAPFILPKQVKERIDYTFQRQTQRNFMGKSFYLDESSAARIDTWTQGISAWSKSPFIGRGAGGAGPSADNQYIRILLETGILGFLGFIFLIFSLYINSLRVLQICQQDNFCYSVVSGFISGLSGLLVHAASAGTFIIIRIMEPFWFLAAIVLTLPALSQENTGDEFKKRDD